MKHIIAFSLVIISNYYAVAQTVGLRYKSTNPNSTDILKTYNTGTKTCGAKTFDVGYYGVLLVIGKIDDNTFAVLLEKNNDNVNTGENFAAITKNYCISKENLNALFKAKGMVDHGVLTIPFKFRYDPVRIMAGGELGYYVGRRWGKLSLVAHGGFSPIALNDVNNDVPETKIGLSFGAGVVYRLTEDFQIGLIEGQDFFEGVETWPYKYKPWLSLTIGFSFLKPNKEAVRAANN